MQEEGAGCQAAGCGGRSRARREGPRREWVEPAAARSASVGDWRAGASARPGVLVASDRSVAGSVRGEETAEAAEESESRKGGAELLNAEDAEGRGGVRKEGAEGLGGKGAEGEGDSDGAGASRTSSGSTTHVC